MEAIQLLVYYRMGITCLHLCAVIICETFAKFGGLLPHNSLLLSLYPTHCIVMVTCTNSRSIKLVA
jgi:hypothetical protein